MNNLNYFNQRFNKQPIVQIKTIYSVFAYSRVSTLEQLMSNSSIDMQDKCIMKCVNDNNYKLLECYGKTNESAKTDYKRKEFMRMVNDIKNPKKRPDAVIVAFMSRFSRSGGGGIKVFQDIIELGVAVIEASSGRCSNNPDDKRRMIGDLLIASDENQNKRNAIIPSLKDFLLNGGWLGTTPRGYTKYGPRVKDRERFSLESRIDINPDGKLLVIAWQKKLEGERDINIILYLKSVGLIIDKRRLSSMWRNYFYCGIGRNSLLDENGGFFIGKWKAIVSEEDFIKINKMLDNIGRGGYEINKDNKEAPLIETLCCNKCGKHLTAYTIKLKGLTYYKCNSCKGENHNANTTIKSQKIGLHQAFVQYLQKYSLNPQFKSIICKQIEKIASNNNKHLIQRISPLKTQINKIDDLLIKHKNDLIYGKLKTEMYDEIVSTLRKDKMEIELLLYDLEKKYLTKI